MTGVSGPSDAELIAASVATPVLFGEVFDRHGGRILRYLTRRIGPQDAEDLLSQTFLVALERRGSFDPAASSARPWLYGIASNLLLRRRRDEARFLRALARVPIPTGVGPFEERAASRVDAEVAAEAVAGPLAGLSADDRNVLLLFAWAELSYDEIAAALGIPVGTVRSRMHRARHQLRKGLQDTPDETRRSQP